MKKNVLCVYRFDIPKENKELFFNNSERSRIVDFILRRQPFGEDKNEAYTFGKSSFRSLLFQKNSLRNIIKVLNN